MSDDMSDRQLAATTRQADSLVPLSG